MAQADQPFPNYPADEDQEDEESQLVIDISDSEVASETNGELEGESEGGAAGGSSSAEAPGEPNVSSLTGFGPLPQIHLGMLFTNQPTDFQLVSPLPPSPEPNEPRQTVPGERLISAVGEERISTQGIWRPSSSPSTQSIDDPTAQAYQPRHPLNYFSHSSSCSLCSVRYSDHPHPSDNTPPASFILLNPPQERSSPAPVTLWRQKVRYWYPVSCTVTRSSSLVYAYTYVGCQWFNSVYHCRSGYPVERPSNHYLPNYRDYYFGGFRIDLTLEQDLLGRYWVEDIGVIPPSRIPPRSPNGNYRGNYRPSTGM